MRAKISFDLAVDIIGVGSTKSANDYKYLTQDISLGFSSPLSKVNGRSYLDRRKDLQITKTKNK